MGSRYEILQNPPIEHKPDSDGAKNRKQPNSLQNSPSWNRSDIQHVAPLVRAENR